MEPLLWSVWSEKIHTRKMTGFVLTLLEGAGPLRYILSQGLFALVPFIDPAAHLSWKAFAEMLENPAETRSFAAYLHEESL